MRYIGFIKSRPSVFKALLKMHEKSIPINAKNICEETEFTIRQSSAMIRSLKDRGIINKNSVSMEFLIYANSYRGLKYMKQISTF